MFSWLGSLMVGTLMRVVVQSDRVGKLGAVAGWHGLDSGRHWGGYPNRCGFRRVVDAAHVKG